MNGPSLAAFTLIELILVMALLVLAVSVTAPTLVRFFRGRTLDAEARRLLALTRGGQSRAVSEGIPIDLWLDLKQGRFGLEAEPTYETTDPKAVELLLDSGLLIEVDRRSAPAAASTSMSSAGQTPGRLSVSKVALAHPELENVRFLPDGTIDPASPQKLRLTDRDGNSLWVAQSRDRLTYEIRTSAE